MPSFQKAVIEAYNEMTSLESPNDFFIASFAPGSTTEELELHSKGKGGMERMNTILKDMFAAEIAVGMFRVTAVDDRGGKVQSYRTKLVHVVYMGPNTPVMKRAKVAPWNSVFKQPFTMNLSVQTDDVDGDLTVAASLRASGGAHQPTSFDFTNTPSGGGSEAPPSPSSYSLPPQSTSPRASTPSSPPRSPSGTRSYIACFNEHTRAFHARDVNALKHQYSDEYCKLIFTDASTGSITVCETMDEISATFERVFDQFRDEYEIVKVDKTQPDAGHTSEGIVFSFWTSEQGSVSAGETLCIVGGKIVMHTIVLNRTVHIHEDVDDVQSQATADDGTTSNMADAGDAPSQEGDVEDGVTSNMADAGDAPSQEGDADESANGQEDEPVETTTTDGEDFVEVEQPAAIEAPADEEDEVVVSPSLESSETTPPAAEEEEEAMQEEPVLEEQAEEAALD